MMQTKDLNINVENQNLNLCLDDNKIKNIVNFFNQKIIKLSNKKFMDFIYEQKFKNYLCWKL